MTEKLHEYVEKMREADASWVVDVIDDRGEVSAVVPRDRIADVCRFLKEQHGFDLLADICGTDDGPEESPRFIVNYHLFSTRHFNRLRLKVHLEEDDAKVESVTGVWKTADWHERETFDMFGIEFENHPDLRRILMPSDFDGHALRKDFPLRGYEPYSMN